MSQLLISTSDSYRCVRCGLEDNASPGFCPACREQLVNKTPKPGDIVRRDGTSLDDVGAYRYASALRRFAAGFIDSFLAIGVGVVVGVVAGFIFIAWASTKHSPSDGANLAGVTELFLLIGAVLVALPLTHIVFAFMIATRGETPGKRTSGLTIVRTSGEGISPFRALIREFIGKLLLYVPLAMMGPALFLLFVHTVDPFLRAIDPITFSEIVDPTFFIAIALLFAGNTWMLVDAKRQGWHDKLADTVVVKVR